MKYHTLLVEDDEVDVMTIQRLFLETGKEDNLDVVGDGIEAIKYLEDNSNMPVRPLVVLLDIKMPRMGGIEFLEFIRKTPSLHKTPVVILSSSNQQQDVNAAYQHHAAGYFVKPVRSDDLRTMFEAIEKYWSFSEIA